ncbi:caspase domain-containing protein [Xylariaceae sp. FL0255]|nr:caspase domain-containing protein [Xylariaceae sp. FL0255]
MTEFNTQPSYWALLIGVNSDSERPLKGCVRDVREITAALKKSLADVKIQLFTADDKNATAESSGSPCFPENLATYSNVKSGLEKVSSLAKSGDYIYIHYSGHGLRLEAASKECSSMTTGDLCLNVLEDAGSNHTKPLSGLDLAQIIRTMVANNVTVTLVLDCCFSGSVLRKQWDSNHRSLRYREVDSKIMDFNFSSPCGRVDRDDTARSYDSQYRDASMLPNWLINPRGYTILTACGPHEIAEELRFPRQSYRHGALSYFILRAIKKLGGLGGKHAHIYPYLCSMFRQYHPKQNPMWYGNPDLCFLGSESPNSVLTGAPFAAIWADDRLQLQGGQAHGISAGDQFAVYTISAGRPLVTGTVNNVRPLTSDIEVSDPQSIRSERGYIAKALTCLSLRKFPVHLSLDPSCLEEWQPALAMHENLMFEDKDHSFAYQISRDENTKTYRIRGPSGHETAFSPEDTREELMMTIPSRVLDIVERMARHDMVKELSNEGGEVPLEGLYCASIIDSAGKAFQGGSVIDNQERDALTLAVENSGQTTLYVHVLNLAPQGQVQNILRASYVVVPPKIPEEGLSGKWTHRVKTIIPQALLHKGILECEDVIKVFITNQPTSFASLEMQKLHDSHDRGAVEPGDMEQTPSSGTEDWVSFNFVIRTHRAC